MDIFHLVRGQAPQRLAALDALPDSGFVWLDFTRDDAHGWPQWPQRLLGVELDRRHVADSLDAAHRAFFDFTPDYDLLIFEEAGPRDEHFPLQTCSAALFLFERVLVTVRDAGNLSFGILRQRFADGGIRSPAGPRVLAQIMLDLMVDRFLAVRDGFTRRMDDVQEALLDPQSPFKDWRQLLAGRRGARQLEYLCEGQVKALDDWHRSSVFEWSNPEETRLRDVTERILRVVHASGELERHIEAAVQLYFASTTHRTSEIVRTLTVFSAIFLPLTFLAGIYGMNFEVMPELRTSFGYPALLMLMVLIAAILLMFFRRRGYF